MRPSEFMQADDGRYWLSQTALNRFRMCPEKARAYWRGETLDPPGPAAILGTAVHAAMEAQFTGANISSAIANAVVKEWTDDLDFSHNDWPTPGRVVSGAGRAYDSLSKALGPISPLGVEQELRSPYSARLGFRGALDLVLDQRPGLMIIDYKASASQKYWGRSHWELQRYAVQPTVYMWLAAQAFGLRLDQVGWNFAVVNPKSLDVRLLPITRNEHDVRRLVGEAEAAIDIWESPLTTWPLRTDGWWCSAKWCPNHSTCPGGNA